MFELPKNFLGADLFWWQESSSIHTLVSILWSARAAKEDSIVLNFVLFDEHGEPVASWEHRPAFLDAIFVDSANPPVPLLDIREGLLGVFVSTEQKPSEKLQRRYHRLYSLVDWYSEDGFACTLHNDQSVTHGQEPIEFTEIVLEEGGECESFLVVLNGPDEVQSQELSFSLTNHLGQTQQALYQRSLKPFSVNKIFVRELFPDAEAFSDGKHLLMGGAFPKSRMFIRPYVMTKTGMLSGYHGGDRYGDIQTIPHFQQKFLERGFVNPIAAVCRGDLSSTANFLNSHGSLEEDFWIDAALYDKEGALVVDKKKWLLSKRNELVRGDIADLLPKGVDEFEGHLVASFSDDEKDAYPGILQILMEYCSAVNVSRVMVWSDAWNTPERLAKSTRPIWHKYQRVWARGPLVTTISITNTANQTDYDQEASYSISLMRADGQKLHWEGSIAPYATDFHKITELFPEVESFLAPLGVGMLFMDSEYDLPSVQFTHHERSNAWAVEHFMSYLTVSEGKLCSAAGS